MKRIVLILLAFVATLPSIGQVVVTESSQAKARINLACSCENSATAARILQEYIELSSGAKLDIVKGKKAKVGDIVIGDKVPDSVTEDGYRLQSRDGVLYIGGVEKGVIYGVISLLERELNADYLAEDVRYVDEKSSIAFGEMDITSNPAFRYRQSAAYGMANDSDYRLWLRLEEPREIFADNLWVHTFNRILPPDKYGDAHPEYYSYIKGEHRPGAASQWCLTNDELFELICHKVDSIFKANPKSNTISISQNDSNFTYCRCEECEKVNEYEGAPSGNYVRFLNRLAERFPDKQFSTLAYLFTMEPPKHVKPLPNVNIMLCNIDCFREVPLTDNASGQHFVKALEGWGKISNNIFVWDYGINFDNYISPFPNFHILQPNMKLFKDNHVTMHFSQINGPYGGDFSEMRTYVVSKLMWDPYQESDAVMRRFTDRYYGAAGRFIYDYEKMLEGGLLASDIGLWIYDSPVTHATGMLNGKSRKHYNLLFDRAEEAVKDDKVLLDRVRMARLPLMFADLEIARTSSDMDVEAITKKLNLFESYIKEYGIKSMNERSNSPADYCELYRTRYMPAEKPSLALGSKIEWETAPDGIYAATGEKFMTDGLYGGATFKDSWTGWEGKDAAFVMDMGSVKDVSMIEADFLHQLGGWILVPKGVTYQVSIDGETFSDFGHVDIPESQDRLVKFVPARVSKDAPVKARYIRVEIDAVKICPPWHYGIGYPCWFMIDEVKVL